MPELVLLYTNGTVEHLALTDVLLDPWTAEDIETLLSSVCSSIERSPGSCRVTVRWLPDGRVTFSAIGSLGQAWMDPVPVMPDCDQGAVERALEGLR